MNAPTSAEEWIEAEVDRATLPYRGRVDSEAYQAMRLQIREALQEHPDLQRLVSAARARAELQHSGDVPTSSAPVIVAPHGKKSGSGAA